MNDNSTICPKSSAPARNLAAMRLEELTSHDWDMRLTLTCLQGIVNRSQPRLYLLADRYDELWLDWLRERRDVDRIEWLGPQYVAVRADQLMALYQQNSRGSEK